MSPYSAATICSAFSEFHHAATFGAEHGMPLQAFSRASSGSPNSGVMNGATTVIVGGSCMALMSTVAGVDAASLMT